MPPHSITIKNETMQPSELVTIQLGLVIRTNVLIIKKLPTRRDHRLICLAAAIFVLCVRLHFTARSKLYF